MPADFIDLNLLPSERRPTRRRGGGGRRNLAGLLGLGLLAFAFLTLFPLLGISYTIGERLETLRASVEASRVGVREADAVLAREAQLQQQIQTTLLQADNLDRQAEQLRTQQLSLSDLLQPMAQALPPRMTIGTVTMLESGTIRVTGEGGSPALVLEFAQALEALPQIRRVNVVGMDRLGGQAAPTAVAYTLEIERQARGG
jgi:hypothetical protein